VETSFPSWIGCLAALAKPESRHRRVSAGGSAVAHRASSFARVDASQICLDMSMQSQGWQNRNRFRPIVSNSFDARKIRTSVMFCSMRGAGAVVLCDAAIHGRIRSRTRFDDSSSPNCRHANPSACHSIRALHRTGKTLDRSPTNGKPRIKTITCDYVLITAACYCQKRAAAASSARFLHCGCTDLP
jgi:hypothetical protein